MPYIAQDQRAKLDAHIDALAEEIASLSKDSDPAFAGLLNYTCTRLALGVTRRRFGQIRYWIIALVTGTFHNVADEFYRRVGGPYEDQAILKNGDVDEIERALGK